MFDSCGRIKEINGGGSIKGGHSCGGEPPELPKRIDFDIIRGSTWARSVRVLFRKTPEMLDESGRVVLAMRRGRGGEIAAKTFTAENQSSDGSVTISLLPDETDEFDLGAYEYQITFYFSKDYVVPALFGIINVRESLTGGADGWTDFNTDNNELVVTSDGRSFYQRSEIMQKYRSRYTGPQIDDAITSVRENAQSWGLFNASDRVKLDGIEAGAQVNTMTSVNGEVGAVMLNAAKIGADSAGSAAAAETNAKAYTDALISAQAQTINSQARRIHLLELAAEGNIYADEADSVAAYSKAIPAEALDCRIDSFGGKSMRMNQLSKTPTFTITASTIYKLISYADTVVGNKYLFYNKCSRASEGADDFQVYCDTAYARYHVDNQSDIFQASASIFKIFASVYGQFGTDVTSNTYVIDLTRIYGAGNEPVALSDPRIAELEAYVDSHPEYDAGTVISADVSAIELSDENEETVTKSIPAAIRALPGYGWSNGTVCNEVDIKNKQYIQRVDGTSGEIVVLDEPIITDISDLLPEGFERFDEVYPEGSITFVQDGGTTLAVPNTETYKIKLPVNATALAAAIDAQLALAAIEALGGGADV